MRKSVFIGLAISLLILASSCKKEVLPKPSSQLRLDYPLAKYEYYKSHCPFEFELNDEDILFEFCLFVRRYGVIANLRQLPSLLLMQNTVLKICLSKCCVYLVYFRNSDVFRDHTVSCKHGFPLVPKMLFSSSHG